MRIIFSFSLFSIFVLICIVGWIRHIIWSISLMKTDDVIYIGEAILALIGLAMPPVGAIHGFVLFLS